MAIRVKFTKSAKPPVKFDQAFSSDRAAALARLAKPAEITDGPEPVAFPLPSVAPEAPGEIAAAPAAAQIRIDPLAPLPDLPPVAPETPGSAAERATPAATQPVSPAAEPDGKPAGGAGAPDPPASEALLTHSPTSSLIRAAGLVFKWSALLGVLVGIGFLAVRFLVPFLQELRHPGKTDAIADKHAPTAVRVIQQTRAVVAKSDAKTAYLNEVVAAVGEKPAVAAPASVAPPPVVQPKASGPVTFAADLAPYQEAVARLKIGGVLEGPVPRIYLNDRIVSYGDIIDRTLGLRFMGVDPKDNAVLFTNADNVVFRKRF